MGHKMIKQLPTPQGAVDSLADAFGALRGPQTPQTPMAINDEEGTDRVVARGEFDGSQGPPSTSGRGIADELVLGTLVDTWRRSRSALSVKSVMGTGKSTLLSRVLIDLPPDATMAILTSRKSLSQELANKLRDLGFVNYLDAEGDLSDRAKYPRVICSVSLGVTMVGGLKLACVVAPPPRWGGGRPGEPPPGV